MTNAVINDKTSKAIKKATNGIRSHFDIVERARSIYLSQIKRAEAEYYERLKRATAILSGEEEATPEPQPTASAQEATN